MIRIPVWKSVWFILKKALSGIKIEKNKFVATYYKYGH